VCDHVWIVCLFSVCANDDEEKRGREREKIRSHICGCGAFEADLCSAHSFSSSSNSFFRSKNIDAINKNGKNFITNMCYTLVLTLLRLPDPADKKRGREKRNKKHKTTETNENQK